MAENIPPAGSDPKSRGPSQSNLPAAKDAESPAGLDNTRSTGAFNTRAGKASRSISQGTSIDIGMSIGPYELIAKLGQGGMGAVYKATHTRLRKVVAFKVLPPEAIGDAEAIARFDREMEAVGRIEHPNIVRAMDAGEIGGIHYLAMEYVEGTDLSKFVKTKGPLSPINACKVIRQVANGLAAAHAAGLVHRDIKPSNILLAKDGKVKILDLGLARVNTGKLQSRDLTATGQTFGTPDFMAPEQWDDTHAADARTDLYALGCTLHYLLTGKAPYSSAQTVGAKLKAHLLSPIPDLRAERPQVPEELARIYARLLAKAPDDRIQAAAELAAMLVPFTTEKPGGNAGPPRTVSFQGAVERPPGSVIEMPIPTRPLRIRHSRAPAWMVWVTLLGGASMMAAVLSIAFVLAGNNKKTGGKPSQAKRTAISQSPPKESLENGSENAAVQKNESSRATPGDAPKPAIAPFDAMQALQYQKDWAKHLGIEPEITNAIGMRLRLIPPGAFTMGASPEEIKLAIENVPDYAKSVIGLEGPARRVNIDRPFYLGAHEVTVEQFGKFVKATKYETGPESNSLGGWGYRNGKHEQSKEFTWRNPEFTNSKELPVVFVEYKDAEAFCAWLSRVDGRQYEIPHESAWEFACRAGTIGPWYWGNQPSASVNHIRPGANPVAGMPPNPFGLYDMLGNVHEYAQADDSYLWRGGGSEGHLWLTRSAARDPWTCDRFNTGFCVGFRVAIVGDLVPSGEGKGEGNVIAKAGARDDLAAIDYAAERRAAQWLSERMSSGKFTLRLENGQMAVLDAGNRTLPNGKFAITEFLDIPEIDVDAMTYLERCRRIETVSLHSNANLTQPAFQGFMDSVAPSLKTFKMAFVHPLIDQVESILGKGSFPRLRNLTLAWDQRGGVWKTSPPLPALRELELSGAAVDAEALQGICETYPNLTLLRLFHRDKNITGDLRSLSKLGSLNDVGVNSHHLTDANIAVLRQLRQLDSIWVCSPVADPPGSLQKLALLGDQLKNVTVYSWAVWDTGPSDADYSVISQLPRIKMLRLIGHAGNPTDEFFAELAKRDSLEELIVAFDVNIRYTQAGIEAFRKARPDVRLELRGRVYEGTNRNANN